MPNEMLPMSTWTPKDGQTYEIVDKDARDRITDLEEHAGDGTVTSVNNVQPDANGNVSLSANDVGAGTYSKPSGGIPASDLASDVQTSLGKADTALQQHQSLAGYATETWVGQQGYQTAQQVQTAIANAAELPSGGQSGQALLSDGSNGAYWGDVQSGGAGLSDDAKAALLACFRNVAWVGSDGQSYYDDLHDALYPPAPPATLLSISAVFNQGSAVIYDTDSLDTLKQYLTVMATYDDSSTGVVTNYTLSGTLTVGTSTITVLYNGKTTTFNVIVSAAYQKVEWIGSTGTQLLEVGISFSDDAQADYEMEAEIAVPEANASTAILMCTSAEAGCYLANVSSGSAVGVGATNYFANLDVTQKHKYILTWDAANVTAVCEGQSITRTRSRQDIAKPSFFGDYEKLFLAKCRIFSAKVRYNGNEIRNLIPCYRKPDSVIGMYDILNDVFYTNSGTGAFTKGSDV